MDARAIVACRSCAILQAVETPSAALYSQKSHAFDSRNVSFSKLFLLFLGFRSQKYILNCTMMAILPSEKNVRFSVLRCGRSSNPLRTPTRGRTPTDGAITAREECRNDVTFAPSCATSRAMATMPTRQPPSSVLSCQQAPVATDRRRARPSCSIALCATLYCNLIVPSKHHPEATSKLFIMHRAGRGTVASSAW